MTGLSAANCGWASVQGACDRLGRGAASGAGGHPALSVVIPNYNHAHYLPMALESILRQAVSPMEVLIYDDASTDESVAVAREFCQRSAHVRLFCAAENRGPVHWMNRALEEASGECVFFMAADDVVLPDFLSRSLDLLARYPDSGLCSTLSRIIDEAGADQGLYPSPLVCRREAYLDPAISLRNLRYRGPWFMGNTTIYRRRFLVSAGGLDPSLRSFCDGFVAQVLALRHGACFIPEPLASWRRTRKGYADADNMAWQQRFEIRERAEELMRTTFRDTFPPDYVRHWERQSRFSAGVAGWRAIRRKQEEMVVELLGRLGPSNPAAEACLLFPLRVLTAVQAVWVRLYLFLRFRGVLGWLQQKLARLHE